MKTIVFDLVIIGGGINGCGIARDAAGRGLSVFLCEKNDLASGTSSASTKLIHGGLRYLEYYEFRLVKEALREREILLTHAPHIVWPLRFILPHHKGLRPSWLIRLGLFLYDHMGHRKLLPPTSTVNLATDEAGIVLKKNYRKGFEYSDCRVLDSRLTILNALDAADLGAEIHTGTSFVSAKRVEDTWHIELFNSNRKEKQIIRSKVLINATGPWLDSVLDTLPHSENGEHIRMVKGSHIVVKSLFNHDRAYIFQNDDGRIIFAIPYEDRFTLIGTTDVDYHGNPDDVEISPEEIRYLCESAGEYFTTPITPEDIVSSFSGIRPLFDDGRNEAKAATRDYVLKLDAPDNRTPLLSIYGGKITTYRKLAESVLKKLEPFLPPMKQPWTATADLPGGNFPPDGFMEEVRKLLATCPDLSRETATRLMRTYGTLAKNMCRNLANEATFGPHFGHGLYGFEVDYLIDREWARSAEDILWRRTRLGLLFSPAETKLLDEYIRTHSPKEEIYAT
ncbi:glycerol-3-phosphate dehydrogenase [Desulfomarina profundi]|uniref:Glycerol-3-phosphate dehydrogenase n=1 Tax=Desulfomarina profundi TaxID=2772557 RepID=A0A8D5FYR3_9BACT|nr:glycerol-3-phosphate dehydrogenase [Desulfomarina profundi]BCL62417.1 glycerol-3-phosphate dehydrogenase [Desulfomarina profundi]